MIVYELCFKKNKTHMTDIYNLVHTLYQAHLQKHPSALIPHPNHQPLKTRFFAEEDLPLLGADIGVTWTIDPSDLSAALNSAVRRGVVVRSVEDTTSCDYSVCTQPTSLPRTLFAYNPNMLAVNADNVKFLQQLNQHVAQQTLVCGQACVPYGLQPSDNFRLGGGLMQLACANYRGSAVGDNPNFLQPRTFRSTPSCGKGGSCS